MIGSSASFDPRDHDSVSGRASRYVSIALSGRPSPSDAAWAAAFELRSALDVAANLHEYRPQTLPERPLSFPVGADDEASDAHLKRAITDARRALRPNSDERALLAEYGEWRHACARVRGEAEGRVGAVIGAIRWLDARGKGDPTAADARADLVTFLASEWGIALGPTVPDYWSAKEIAKAAVARLRAARPRAMLDEPRESGREERGW